MLRRYADDGGKDPLHPWRFPNSAARENSLHVHAKVNRVLDQLHAKTGLAALRFQDFFLGTILPFLRAFDRPIAIVYGTKLRLRASQLGCCIHSGSGPPSRRLPPMTAAAQAVTAPSSVAAANEKATITVM